MLAPGVMILVGDLMRESANVIMRLHKRFLYYLLFTSCPQKRIQAWVTLLLMEIELKLLKLKIVSYSFVCNARENSSI